MPPTPTPKFFTTELITNFIKFPIFAAFYTYHVDFWVSNARYNIFTGFRKQHLKYHLEFFFFSGA